MNYSMHGGYRINNEFASIVEKSSIEDIKKMFEAAYNCRTVSKYSWNSHIISSGSVLDDEDRLIIWPNETYEELNNCKDKTMYLGEILRDLMEPNEFDDLVETMFFESIVITDPNICVCNSTFEIFTLLSSDDRKEKVLNEYKSYLEENNPLGIKLEPSAVGNPLFYMYVVLPSLSSEELKLNWAKEIKDSNVPMILFDLKEDNISGDSLYNIIDEMSLRYERKINIQNDYNARPEEGSRMRFEEEKIKIKQRFEDASEITRIKDTLNELIETYEREGLPSTITIDNHKEPNNIDTFYGENIIYDSLGNIVMFEVPSFNN